jgi:Tfp pilus assembly protein PilV
MSLRRAGFTLVEVLIAVVLIDVGLLALVAGSAVLVRRAAEVRTRSSALRAAGNRIQALSAAHCSATTGSANAAGLTEAWMVTLQPNHVRELRESVAFTVGGVPKSVTLVTRLPC